jgi:SulP family sulfate permease
VIGIALAIAVHLWRELHVEVVVWGDGHDLHLRPGGVLWFEAAQRLEDRALAALAAHADARRLVLHLDGIGRLDLTSASALRRVIEEARRSGLDTELVGIEARDRRLIDRVGRNCSRTTAASAPTTRAVRSRRKSIAARSWYSG